MKALVLLSSLSLSISAFAQQVIIQQQTTTTTTSPYFQNPGWGVNTQFQTFPNQFNYFVDPNVQMQTWGTPGFGCADPVMQVQPQYYIDPFTGQPVYVEQFVQPQQQYYVDQFGNYIPVGQPQQQQIIYQQQLPVQQQFYQVQPTQVMQNPVMFAPDAASFSMMIQQISSQPFEDNRLQVAQQIVMSNRVTSAQVTDIARLFSFESTRLQFAKFAYGYVIDPNSYFMVNNAFSFSSSVDDLHRFITGSR